MQRRRQLLAGLAAATAGTALAERRHMRRIASDPEHEALRDPPAGAPMRVHSADGTELHAEVFDGEAPTFVLAHGWTESLSFWTYVIRDLALERGFRVVAYDLRGHGHSAPAADGDYAIERFGEDLAAVLEASVAGEQPAIVAGHSLGAMSIAAWAAGHDVRLRAAAAALVNTGVGDLLSEQLLIPVPWIAQLLNRLLPARATLGSRMPLPHFSTPLSYGVARYVAFGPSASPAQIAFYERMLIATPPDARASVGIALSELELRHALPRLTIPTLVVAGEADRLTPPSHARRIAEELPQLERLIVLPGAGHMTPLERPRELGAALAALAAHVAAEEQVAV